MAYADQKMSSNRLIALIVVAILHVALAYGLVTGLAYEGVKKAIEVALRAAENKVVEAIEAGVAHPEHVPEADEDPEIA